ncbi:MAG: flagellar hook assembly protein FlgD [Bacillota bacterium]
MDSVKATGNSDYYVPEKKAREAKKTLGRDEFLSLLVAQLKNQDPLEPQSNEEFISTMAQFNSLDTLVSLEKNTQYSQAISLINKPVTVQKLNEEPVTSFVEKAGTDSGKVVVYVDGEKYSLSEVREILPGDMDQVLVKSEDLLQAAMLIGREVLLSNSTAGGKVEKVGIVDGLVKVYINGSPYNISQISEIKEPGEIAGNLTGTEVDQDEGTQQGG